MDVVYPNTYMIRTRRGIYVEMVVLFMLVALTVIFEYVRAQRGVGSGAVMGFNWISVVIATFIPMVGTVRVLRHLEKLERTVVEPNETMTFLFQVAAMLPITGYLPMLILLR